VIEDDAVVVVDDLALVTKLDRFTQPALGDRSRITVMQTDHPAGSIRGGPGDALPGLPDDLLGRRQQPRQVADGAGQPTTPAPRGRIVHACLGQLGRYDPCLPQRPPRIDQQMVRIPHGRLGQIGQFPGDPLHTVFDLVATQLAAGPQLRGDPVCPLPRGAGAVPQPGPHRAARVMDPLPGHRDPADRLGQQPGIGRVAHVRRDHRGVRANPAGAQQLRPGGLGQQRLVESVHRGAATPSGSASSTSSDAAATHPAESGRTAAR